MDGIAGAFILVMLIILMILFYLVLKLCKDSIEEPESTMTVRRPQQYSNVQREKRVYYSSSRPSRYHYSASDDLYLQEPLHVSPLPAGVEYVAAAAMSLNECACPTGESCCHRNVTSVVELHESYPSTDYVTASTNECVSPPATEEFCYRSSTPDNNDTYDYGGRCDNDYTNTDSYDYTSTVDYSDSCQVDTSDYSCCVDDS